MFALRAFFLSCSRRRLWIFSTTSSVSMVFLFFASLKKVGNIACSQAFLLRRDRSDLGFLPECFCISGRLCDGDIMLQQVPAKEMEPPTFPLQSVISTPDK